MVCGSSRGSEVPVLCMACAGARLLEMAIHFVCIATSPEFATSMPKKTTCMGDVGCLPSIPYCHKGLVGFTPEEDNIIAALEQHDRVCESGPWPFSPIRSGPSGKWTTSRLSTVQNWRHDILCTKFHISRFSTGYKYIYYEVLCDAVESSKNHPQCCTDLSRQGSNCDNCGSVTFCPALSRTVDMTRSLLIGESESPLSSSHLPLVSQSRGLDRPLKDGGVPPCFD
jgi:hypothetical protein